MAQIKNIIFDWSGTLVDDLPFIFESVNYIFEKCGKSRFSIEEFREKFFMPYPDFFKKYLPELPLADLHKYFDSVPQHLQDKIRMLAGTVETLEYCHAEKFKVFLLSAIPQEHFDVWSEKFNVRRFFTQAYTMAIDKRQTIFQVLNDHHLAANETIFVGDMRHDMDAAHAAGVKACAVLTGYDSLEKLKLSQPDFLFRDLNGLLNHLKASRKGEESHPIATVGALIKNDDDKLLMIRTHKWSNRWGIPGGKIQLNETSEQALIREVKEETNLDVDSVEFVMIQDCIMPEEFYKPIHFLLLNYTAHAASLDVTLNDEAFDCKWVTVEEALKLDLNKPTRTLIEKVYQLEPQAA